MVLPYETLKPNQVPPTCTAIFSLLLNACLSFLMLTTACNVYIPRQSDASQLVELEGTEKSIAAAKAEIESLLRVEVQLLPLFFPSFSDN
jgi:hypothetical protein